MSLDALFQLHPLSGFAVVALISLILGLQAAVGANLGYRRGLEWQTAFFLGLVLSGLFFAVYYSIRPIERQGQIEAPKWLKFLGLWPSIVLSGIFLLIFGAIEIMMAGTPAAIMHAPVDSLYKVGSFLYWPAIPIFIALGGYLGKLWYNNKPETKQVQNSEEVDDSPYVVTP